MKNRFIPAAVLLLWAVGISAQNSIQAVLESVEKNNKTLAANAQYWEARNLAYKIGLSLPDPTIGLDYLAGFPSGAGNQTEFTVAQSFDFPTVYKRRRELSDLQTSKRQYYLAAQRQGILLEAKLQGIELIFLNKKQAALTTRLQKTERLLEDFQTRLDKGEGNILDVNKAKLQRLDLQNELRLTAAAIAERQTRLTELNGGISLTVTDTLYPLLPELPADFETLEQTIEQVDPARLALTQEIAVAQKQVEVTKGLNLPKFEAGYRYQGILGQQFHGLHLGVSVPIWENKLKVAQRQAEMNYAAAELEMHRNEHFNEIKLQYGLYQNLSAALAEYRSLLPETGNAALLDKALTLGEITTIQYFLENAYAFEAQDKLLELERKVQVAAAELQKWRL